MSEDLDQKRRLLASTIRVAHMAGKQDIVKRAMDSLKHLADVTKVEVVREAFERLEEVLSIETPQKAEIDRSWYDVD